MRESSGNSALAKAAIVAGAILLMVFMVSRLDPFGESTIDRTGPAVLKSIENLGELKSASANIESVSQPLSPASNNRCSGKRSANASKARMIRPTFFPGSSVPTYKIYGNEPA